jgi:integral membrane protein
MIQLSTPLDRVRTIGLWEGWSFLLLIGVAMPLKYLAGQPMAVTVVGGAHGALFLAYWAVIIEAAVMDSWPWKRAVLLLAAAVVPGGPFLAEAKILKPLAEEKERGEK